MSKIVLEGLEESFDNDKAESMLNLSIGRMTRTSDLVRKSMYDFDLETPDGIEKLMALLPIMDPEILKDIMGEIWPGYPTDIDARKHRLEIKGYLKDFLESNEQETTAEQPGSEEGSPEDPNAAGQEATGDSPEAFTTSGSPAGATPPQPGTDEQAPAAQGAPAGDAPEAPKV